MLVTRQRWDVNEIAFLKYARHKDLKGKEVGVLFPERTQPAINTMASAINLFEMGKSDPTTSLSLLIQKALQLEQQVYGGQYPEMRDHWNEKISKVNGIIYSVKKEIPEESAPAQHFEHTVEKVKTVNKENYYLIVEWLYAHDRAFDTAGGWKKAFLTFLREQLCAE